MRQTALRVKMNLALKANIADMAEFAKAVQINEKLRAYAKELGYVETADFSSVVGSFDFGDDKPEFAHKGDSASGD